MVQTARFEDFWDIALAGAIGGSEVPADSVNNTPTFFVVKVNLLCLSAGQVHAFAKSWGDGLGREAESPFLE